MPAALLQGASSIRYPWYVTVLRFAFAALLLVAAVTKLLDFPDFVAVVGTYQTLPEFLLTPAAVALVLTELVLGVWLLWGWRLAEATIANVLLHLGYLGWLALARAHGLELPNCGCFGVFFLQRLTPWMLLEDGILLAAAMALWFGARASSRKLGRAVPFAGRG